MVSIATVSIAMVRTSAASWPTSPTTSAHTTTLPLYTHHTTAVLPPYLHLQGPARPLPHPLHSLAWATPTTLASPGTLRYIYIYIYTQARCAMSRTTSAADRSSSRGSCSTTRSCARARPSPHCWATSEGPRQLVAHIPRHRGTPRDIS